MVCRKFGLDGHSHAPSASTSSGHKSSKCSHLDSQLESVSNEQSQLVNLAKTLHKIKIASLGVKHLKIEQARDSKQLAAKERALILKKQMQEKELESKNLMQEKELASKEQMLKYELELT
jgi:hypothetical protein